MPRPRKTRGIWEIQGNNGYGWECETTEESWKDARAQLKCYRENVPYPVRAVKKRERIEEAARPVANRAGSRVTRVAAGVQLTGAVLTVGDDGMVRVRWDAPADCCAWYWPHELAPEGAVLIAGPVASEMEEARRG